jgi:basic membrane protein A
MGERGVVTRRQFVIGGLGATALVTMTGSARAIRAIAQEETLKAAWVYVGPVSDDGWTAAHDEGRKAVVAAFPDKIETAYAESIPEAPADAERVIRDFAQKGNQLIFTTSFGYMRPTINVAKDFPDTVFIHISGFMTAENVGTGFAKIEEPRYVTGLIAGQMTKSNLLGYVAAFPIPEVIRGINAFTLGVRKVNPAATVKVVWTSTWFDPPTERAAAEALLDSGVDVTGQHQDSAATLQAAEAHGAYGVGYDSYNMTGKAPKATLTSPVFVWGPFYIQTVQAVMDGTWTTNQFWGGWKDGAVDIAPIGDMVPEEVKAGALAEAEKFKKGEQTIYTIFTGPLKDQTGAEKVPAGVAMTDEELLGMSWFVEGVEGEAAGG